MRLLEQEAAKLTQVAVTSGMKAARATVAATMIATLQPLPVTSRCTFHL